MCVYWIGDVDVLKAGVMLPCKILTVIKIELTIFLNKNDTLFGWKRGNVLHEDTKRLIQ